MQPRNRNLGFIPQLIVGATDISIAAGTAGASYYQQKKYEEKTKELATKSRLAEEKAKKIEFAQRRGTARQKLQTTRHQSEGFKKLLLLGFGVTIVVSLIGMGVFYSLSQKGKK